MKYDQEYIDLAREVLEATGWDDTEDILRKVDLREDLLRLTRPSGGVQIMTLSGTPEWEIPRYTVDYLLSKIPAQTDKGEWFAMEKMDDKDYEFGYRDMTAKFGEDFIAPTGRHEDPVKAFMKLIVELKKDGKL